MTEKETTETLSTATVEIEKADSPNEEIKKLFIGYAICASHCTFDESIEHMRKLKLKGHDILPIMSPNSYNTDTRFGNARDFISKITKICGRNIIHTIVEAEPLGPKIKLDALVIAPCTGNTLAKLANGITDTSVCMAAKAHLRNDRPLIISLATNDALAGNLKNIATMLDKKNVYFVPLTQDDHVKKPHSMVADFSKLEQTIYSAIKGEQIQKVIF